MAAARLLVGVDACVLVEAVLFEGTDYPSARMIAAGQAGVFRILLVAQVEQEARRALRAGRDGVNREPDLDALLERCEIVRCLDATPEQIAADRRALWELLRDEPDADIAVAVKRCPHRPHAFVSSNKEHWRPSASLNQALGGVEVMKPGPFLRRIAAP